METNKMAYLVYECMPYEGKNVVKAFSKRESADACCAELTSKLKNPKSLHSDWYEVEAIELEE